MKRDFSNLRGASAASVNAGTLGIQKDKVVYLDPNAEILYDPSENVRDSDFQEDDREGLIALRLSMDEAEQLQPIRVYPLPADKLDPSKPTLKYGIGYGHRRMLSCRLTKKDHPQIGDMPRKVAAVIDVDWLKRGKSYRLRCQIQENNNRRELNYVEQGMAIRSFRDELSREEGRPVPQRELMEIFNIPEKTLGYLMLAAEFHAIAKAASSRKLLTDLDSLVTFDSICKANTEFAKAIYDSLLDKEAPRTRSLIRAAKAKIETEPDYKVDPETWAWPNSILSEEAGSAAQQPPAQVQMPVGSIPAAHNEPVATPVSQSVDGSSAAIHSGASHDQLPSEANPGAERSSSGDSAHDDDESGHSGSGSSVVPFSKTGETSSNPVQPAAPAKGATQQLPGDTAAKGPIIMVSFKMGDEAPTSFNGELLLNRKAKAPSMGVVAYLNEGREEVIEVPLKHVELVSINHS